MPQKCLSDLSGGVLIATNKQDITIDFIIRELRRRDAPFLRLNTEDLPRMIFKFSDSPTLSGSLKVRDRNYDLDTFRSAYYRRPEAPVPHGAENTEAYIYSVHEWSGAARSLWNSMEGRWLNSPFSILRAEDKPRQLAVARACGLRVPPTLIGNDFVAACAFLKGRRCVVKPLRRALVEAPNGPGHVIFTSELTDLKEADRSAFEAVPVIVQTLIAKRRDIRVTVVDRTVIAVAIHSQAYEETSVDWRRGERKDLFHERIDLPDNIAAACVDVTRALDLRFAAIDLVEDVDGAFWFLEANPNGQWAWLEQVEGVKISAAIVDALLR